MQNILIWKEMLFSRSRMVLLNRVCQNVYSSSIQRSVLHNWSDKKKMFIFNENHMRGGMLFPGKGLLGRNGKGYF